ncbi:hypothetical protein D8S82_17255 [Mycobacterium hodleri]|uniref:Uncharacterized protein n=1 Tax=Mycolicibacterium hodleri TaxID=49897 RepID=A0A544VZH0_9MYCO|nr:hypothetical protein [Mycolicibacterium hodleri]TQR85375.1 hypothetical protein D8S82_17255 [Mycolicibacterium hodleri]
MFAVSCIAFMKRASHQMRRHAMVRLSFAAGLLWPLLALAGVQAVALLILKTALGFVRGGSSAVDGVETPAVASLTPAPAAAAA